jgi:dTDP-4-amino-4,6-dideoxygalactose transaminase
MITRAASDTANCAKRVVFTASARVAWKLALKAVGFRSGQSVLLPAYIGITDREGSGIIDPVEECGIPFSLYPVGDRLQVDFAAVERMLSSGCHPLMLAVHYFGFPHAALAALRRLCDRHHTILVEDCAHVSSLLHNDSALGAAGHAAIYSLHKSIAVQTGGLLRINEDFGAIPVPDATERCAVDVLEQLARTDMRAICEARQRNYEWLSQRLTGTDGLTVLYPQLDGVTPHDFPIRVHDGLREKLYFALMDEGLPTIALYYRLIAAITPQDFPLSHDLARSILNLPVHQDTSLDDLDRLADRLEALLTALRS